MHCTEVPQILLANYGTVAEVAAALKSGVFRFGSSAAIDGAAKVMMGGQETPLQHFIVHDK